MSRALSKVVATAITAFMACVFALAIVLLFPDQVLSPMAYLDYRACMQVQPGMPEAEVMELMGEPLSRDKFSSGEKLLQYGTQWSGSGPITIVMRKDGSNAVDYAQCQGFG